MLFIIASMLTTAVAATPHAQSVDALMRAEGGPVPYRAGAGRAPASTDDPTAGHMPGRPNRSDDRHATPAFGSTATLYVDDTAPLGGDGESWATAYRSLRQALLDADADQTITEIRVAAGTYRPTDGEGTPDDPDPTDITAVFSLVDQTNLRVLGGFPDGGGDIEDRDPAVHQTILSGDLLGNDVTPIFVGVNDAFTNAADAGLIFYNIIDNSETVLIVSGADDSVVVDGLIVQSGHDPARGGGLAAVNSSVEIRNCTFRWNSAPTEGGAAFVANGTGVYRFIDCTFENNGTLDNGGAIYVINSPIEIVSTRFVENDAVDGGGVFIANAGSQSTSVVACSFERNFASSWGGGLHCNSGTTLVIDSTQFTGNSAINRGGGLSTSSVADVDGSSFEGNRAGANSAGLGGAVYFGTSSNTIDGTVFIANGAGSGGGGAVYASSSDRITACDFFDNTASLGGGGALLISSSSTVTDCRFERNEAVFNVGGAIYFTSSSNVLTWSTFIDNRSGLASDGGAIYIASSTNSVSNSDFSRNTAGRHGGAAYFASSNNTVSGCTIEESTAGGDGGAVWGRGIISNCTLQNNLAGSDGGGAFWQGTVQRSRFLNNAASRGGGFAQLNTTDSTINDTLFAFNYSSGSGGAVNDFRGFLINNTLHGNTAGQYGGLSSPVPNTITSCIFWENRDLVGNSTEKQQIGPQFHVVADSLIEGLIEQAGNGNIDDDPLFISPLGPDGFANTGDEDFRLRSASPAIDNGQAIEAGPVTQLELEQRDAAGFQRFVDFGGDAIERRIDMGSFEAQDCDADGVDDLLAIAEGDADDCNGDNLIDSCTNDSFLLGTTTRVIPSEIDGSDYFGFGSMATDGERIVVGAHRDDDLGGDAGAAYVLIRGGAGWVTEQKLTSSTGSGSDYFGIATDMSNGRIAVGAYLDDDLGSNAGAVFLYEHDGQSWVETQVVTPGDPNSSDYFGFSLVFAGETLIVSAYLDDERASDGGAVYIFEPDTDGAYVQVQKLTASDGANSDQFGYRLDADGDDLIVGARLDDNERGGDAGAAYVFTRDAGLYQERGKLIASDGAASDYFGRDVAIEGDLAVIGANLDDNENGSDAGAAYVWQRLGQVWIEQQKLVAGDGAGNDIYGASVDTDGERIVVGARFARHDQNPTSYPDNGSAYIYEFDGGAWAESGKLLPTQLENSAYYGEFVELDAGMLLVSAYLENGPVSNSGTLYVHEVLTTDDDMDGVPDDCPDGTSGCNPADIAEPIGLLDLADVIAFISAFTTADPAADLDGNTLYDLADVLLFVNAFTSGCP